MINNTYDRLEKLQNYVSKEQLFDELVQWLDDDEVNEFIDQVITDNDLDYFENEDEL